MGPTHPLSARQDDDSQTDAPLARFAELTLDYVGRTLLAADGREIPLTRGEFLLLCAMVRGRGRGTDPRSPARRCRRPTGRTVRSQH